MREAPVKEQMEVIGASDGVRIGAADKLPAPQAQQAVLPVSDVGALSLLACVVRGAASVSMLRP
jgi:hypothetical protein